MSDNHVVERNWRGQYPPVAILQNTRRALSASAHSAKREQPTNNVLMFDLAVTYRDILDIENYIRALHGIKLVRSVPTWVVDTILELEHSVVDRYP